jgi:hypothetical protein
MSAETPAPTLPSPAPPRGVFVGRLHNASGIRQELARLYRAGRRGEIDAGDASKLGSLLGLLLRAVEGTDLEQRVAAIENDKRPGPRRIS